jgi:hypothetical protein
MSFPASGRKRKGLSEPEEAIWTSFFVKVSGTLQSRRAEFAELFRGLQCMSDYWTGDHIRAWIHNHSLHKCRSYYPEILEQIPEEPPRAAEPPSPAWSFGQSDQPNTSSAFLDSPAPESVSIAEEISIDDEAATAVKKILQSLIGSLTSPSLYENLAKGEHDLFNFVSEWLSQHLTHELSLLVRQVLSQHGETIAEGLAIEKSARRFQQLHESKLRKQNERKERHKRVGQNITQWQAEQAAMYTREIHDHGPDQMDPDDLIVSDDSVIDSMSDVVVSNEDENPNPTYERDQEIRAAYYKEFIKLCEQKSVRSYADAPLTLKLAYLLSTISDRALNIARHFLPLPGPKTIFRHYNRDVTKIAQRLQSQDQINDQISDFVKLNDLSPETPISVSIDAMAMNPDQSTLPAAQGQYAFVIYGQPLDRRKRCMPLHVINTKSGQATEKVQKVLNCVCTNLAERGLPVRYVCSDGDPGYNTRHAEFFDKWFPDFLVGGLEAALRRISQEFNIPVSDFLHIWKLFLARMKNHPVTLSPDSLDHLVTGDGLEEFLHLGNALKDKSSIGKMRDAYALQCFSLENCLKCLEKDRLTEFLYLLPFTLQQDVIRNPELSRYDRLAKAVLSFKLLVHYCTLSFGDRLPTVTQRFQSKKTEALTFAENSVWPRLLNSALALIQFIIEADGDWSFSRLGSHCLENFFGFIRQNSRGDDRYKMAVHIIAKTQMVCWLMNDLNFVTKHRGRDNVGGVVIGDGPIELMIPPVVSELFKSMITLSALDIGDSESDEMVNFPKTMYSLTTLFKFWCNGGIIDLRRPKCIKVTSSLSMSIANCRIMPRIKSVQTSPRQHGWPNM